MGTGGINIRLLWWHLQISKKYDIKIVFSKYHWDTKLSDGWFKIYEWDMEIHQTQMIEYNGYLYWYQYKTAKDRVDICLGTTDPKKYCNGFYLYSTKDPGNGKAFVVTKTNNPNPNWFEN